MDSEFSRYLSKIAGSCNFAEGGAGVKKVLVEIYRHGKVSVRDLAYLTRIAPPVISLLVKKLADDKLLFRDKNGVGYNEEGMKYVEERVGIRSLPSIDCEECGGSTIDINASSSYDAVYDELESIAESRPSADVSVDQAKCTTETLLRRLLFLHKWHAFDGTRIAFMGDDDFVSVACHAPSFLESFFIPTKNNHKIPFSLTVLDIDSRILDSIKNELNARGVNSQQIVKYDAKDPVPRELVNLYDVVFMDPPYTLEGFTLFFSRGVSLLKNAPGSRIFLSFGHMSNGVLQEMQGVILNAGFLIEEVIPAFNEYEGGNIIGNISQMHVLTAVNDLNPPVKPDEKYTGSMYTAEC